MKKIFLAITLIGLISCSNQEDELQELINENPPIEVPPPCDCETLYWKENITRFNFAFTYEWEVYKTEQTCDAISTNGEKILDTNRNKVRELPYYNGTKSIYYYEVKCKSDENG